MTSSAHTYKAMPSLIGRGVVELGLAAVLPRTYSLVAGEPPRPFPHVPAYSRYLTRIKPGGEAPPFMHTICVLARLMLRCPCKARRDTGARGALGS